MKARLARLVACALPPLALWAVMLLALGPQASAFWQCQGRPCGATAWTCCCNSRSGDCGQECVSASRPSPFGALESVATIGHSANSCHCTVASQDVPQSLKSPAPFFAPPALVISTIEPVVGFELAPDVTPLRPTVSRGPPRAVYVASSCLRGPPRA